jgi:uroporphyrinogen-III synthase
MRILLTRPEADGERSAARLESLGHEVLRGPVLEIVPTGTPVPDKVFDALIATSAHAFLDLRGTSPRLRTLPAHVVGARTAVAARRAGFEQPGIIGRDGRDLATRLLAQTRAPARFLYLAGLDRRPEVEAMLAGAGHAVTPCITYEARAAQTLPTFVLDALRRDAIDAVLHFSPRSVALYLAIAERAGLLKEALRPLQIAISQATADSLGTQTRRIAIAPTPDLDGMIACLT